MEKEIDLRRLVIKAFHITEVEEGGGNKVTASGKMTIEKKILDEILPKYPQLSKLDVQIIRPGEHDRYTNTMMDIIPISTKVLGKIGDGITHTLTGVYVILTGVDENGKQAHEFGSSEGNLKEKLYLNRAGTPGAVSYTHLSHGYFSPLEREFLKKLQRVIEGKDVEVFHSGDMDYGGIRIFEYIQKHIFPGIKPLQMDVETYEKYEEYAKTISKETMEKLEKVNVPLLEELKEKLLETGKGIEQESFLIEE